MSDNSSSITSNLDLNSVFNDNRTIYVEIEQKYKADSVNVNDFIAKLETFNPDSKLFVSGPDIYYEKGSDVLRWRNAADKNEFTIKKRHSSKNTFIRDEVDLKISDNSPETIVKFIEALGYTKCFKIFKNCFIFWFSSEMGKVSVVIYEVTDEAGYIKRFIEIEAEKGQHYQKSKKLVRFWENRLDLKVRQRISKSLYEIYSNKQLNIISNRKLCCTCGTLKPDSDFYARRNKLKHSDTCVSCHKIRDKSLEKRIYKKLWRERTKESRKNYMKLYRSTNKSKLAKYALDSQKKRWKSDPLFKLTHTLITRLNGAIRAARTVKNKSTECYLGCTYDFLLHYIESKFHNHPISNIKMTWDNWGSGPGTWQLDHIIPFISVDLSDPEQISAVNNYLNLRPLWYEEHLNKSIFERSLSNKKKRNKL